MKFCFSLQEYPIPDWCNTIQPGPESSLQDPIALAHMHSQIRFFGLNKKYSDADQALVSGFVSQTPLHMTDLSFYNSHIADACVIGTNNQELENSSVIVKNKIVFIKPGKGQIAVPENVSAAVIDLRNLPNVPELKEALDNAIAAVSVTSIEKAKYKVRSHLGLTDEVVAYPHPAYANTIEIREQSRILGKHKRDLPVALIVDSSQAPSVAEFVINLRLQQRAWIVGSKIYAGVAESDFYSVNQNGIAIRTKEFIYKNKRWPDYINPDYSINDFIKIEKQLPGLGTPKIFDYNNSNRAELTVMNPFKDYQNPINPKQDLFASLVIVQGTLPLFFPFYDEMKNEINNRYLEVLNKVFQTEEIDTFIARNFLRRYGEVLHDGHNFVTFHEGPSTGGIFPVVLNAIEGKAVVRRSLIEGLNPGDTIEKIDDEFMSDWLIRELNRTSADTIGYKFDLSLREFLGINKNSLLIETLSLNGVKKTMNINAYPDETILNLNFNPSLRADGWLTDLNAPKIFYINVGAEKSIEEFNKSLSLAKNSQALVLDIRGYPSFNHYEAAQRIICKPFQTPIFKTPNWLNPVEKTIVQDQGTLEPEQNPSYCGPIAILIGPHTVSAAENFSTMLVDAKRVTVIGEQSAGTNGDITGVQLPGSFAFSFTGLEVLHANGNPFRQIGIIPQIEVKEKAEDYRDNKDRILEKAIEVLSYK